MTNNKGGRLTTFAAELGFKLEHLKDDDDPYKIHERHQDLRNKMFGKNKSDAQPDESEIARWEQVQHIIDSYNISRHLSMEELFEFLRKLTAKAKEVRDINVEKISNYNRNFDWVAELLMVESKNPYAVKYTYDKQKMDTKNLQTHIRVLKLEDAWGIVDKEPYIFKTTFMIGDAYNQCATLGPVIKDYMLEKKSGGMSDYDINKNVVLPKIVDPLLETLYSTFPDALNSKLYQSFNWNLGNIDLGELTIF